MRNVSVLHHVDDWSKVEAGTKVNIQNKVFFKFVPCWRKPVCLKDVTTGELSYYNPEEVLIVFKVGVQNAD